MVHSPFIISDEPHTEPGEPGDYMVMFSSRRPSQQLLLTRHREEAEEEQQIFQLEQMNISSSSSSAEAGAGRDGLAGLSGLERRRYRKANKHRGDYCLLDLGEGAASKRRSSSFSSGMGVSSGRQRQWKTITYNKK